jgi:hypothetical protein
MHVVTPLSSFNIILPHSSHAWQSHIKSFDAVSVSTSLDGKWRVHTHDGTVLGLIRGQVVDLVIVQRLRLQASQARLCFVSYPVSQTCSLFGFLS